MNLESLRRNKVGVAVGVLVLLAVVGGVYLAFADDEPVEISNAEELQQVREDLDGHYVLVDGIDLSNIDNFEPIGGFTGTFDGNGHTISGLTIDRPETDRVGMFRAVNEETRFFGLVDDEGTIEDLILRDVNVTGGEFVGGLVGINVGTVTNSAVDGEVTGESRVGAVVGLNGNGGRLGGLRAEGSVSGGEKAGGLVGENADEVLESHAEVNVTGDEWVGGLVGSNEYRATVTESYATGDVSGEGGLVGINTGEVRDSYATGEVERGGGLVGWNMGSVHTSYATGKVTDSAGGLVGGNDGDVADSYWDVNSTGQTISDGGVALTTSEMTGSSARESMDGFDFEETWETVTNPDDYPRLAWQSETDE